MLKKLVLGLFGITMVSFAAEDSSKVTLSTENSVVLNWVVTDQSAAELANKVLQVSQSLPKSKPIYLVLDTPGGSIAAGTSLIDALKAVPQEIKTVNLFSASMGFQIAQNLGERLVTTNSIMMSHLAAGGIEGTIPGSLDSRLSLWTSIVSDLDSQAASRMKLSKGNYRTKIENEYWVYGGSNVSEHTADRLVTVGCDESLKGTEISEVATAFGPVQVERAKCPMVRGILSAKMAGEGIYPVSQDMNEFKKALYLLLNDKTAFTHEFITSGKFQRLGF